MSISLKPLAQRSRAPRTSSAGSLPKLAQVQGIQLFMEPVQNITVDDRVSRTQYQYTLEDPDSNELNQWTNRFVGRLKQLPELANVATDQQPGGLAVYLVIDRITASRLGIAPSTIDNTLYDAFGQRQINTMYTQVNQYHVILESEPQFQQDPDKLNHLYIQSNASSGTSGAGASASFASIGSASAGSNALNELGSIHARGQYACAPRERPDGRHGDFEFRQSEASAGATSSDHEQRGTAQRLFAFREDHRTAVHYPSGPVPGHHGLVRSGAECLAGQCNHGGR
jgi:hypothetical protein